MDQSAPSVDSRWINPHRVSILSELGTLRGTRTTLQWNRRRAALQWNRRRGGTSAVLECNRRREKRGVLSPHSMAGGGPRLGDVALVLVSRLDGAVVPPTGRRVRLVREEGRDVSSQYGGGGGGGVPPERPPAQPAILLRTRRAARRPGRPLRAAPRVGSEKRGGRNAERSSFSQRQGSESNLGKRRREGTGGGAPHLRHLPLPELLPEAQLRRARRGARRAAVAHRLPPRAPTTR